MKLENSPNINYLWSGLIIEELVRNNVVKFCIAPGSRSTPLTLSAAECEKADKLVHFDERGLGFYALGVSSGGKGPAVLISTSGTAVANFLPAVIEASKKKVPLILLTADRPPELRKTGALQTIDQPGIFGKYVKWDFDLPVPDINIKPEMVLTTIDQAVFMATSSTPGPVHINCMFREPLAPEKDEGKWKDKISDLNKWAEGSSPYTEYIKGKESLPAGDLREIEDIVKGSGDGLIVCGKLKPGDEDKVIELAEKLKWPVFPDLTSGLRLRKDSSEIIHNFDQLLITDILDNEKIETIIHIGGRITSKRYYQMVEKKRPLNYITVLDHPLRNDPLHIVTHRVKSGVSEFIDKLVPGVSVKKEGKLAEKLKTSSETIEEIIEKFLGEEDLNEMFISREISKLIPDENALFLSNSMPVRDMDMYAEPMDKDLFVSGNRGASGIDGIIATACGYVDTLKKPGTLLIGDLAFLHDLNSLSLLNRIRKKLVIVVINNDGGTIFSFLPVAEYRENFEEYFTTPHGMDFEHAAKQFKIKYSNATTKQEFSDQYRSALENDQSSIIEAVVDMEGNIDSHKELQSIIKKELNKINFIEGE
ncbi:MAG: 2-succinyl-5-enolpyruvyl-6-hydroxy-3-cyclohexene-1-carboxylic-acid synthase [Acidobacteriota bacterium]